MAIPVPTAAAASTVAARSAAFFRVMTASSSPRIPPGPFRHGRARDETAVRVGFSSILIFKAPEWEGDAGPRRRRRAEVGRAAPARAHRGGLRRRRRPHRRRRSLDGAVGRVRRDRARPDAAGARRVSRSAAGCATAACGHPCSCSPPATASRTGSPGSMPAPTTTCQSRSRSRSSSPGCGRSRGAVAQSARRCSRSARCGSTRRRTGCGAARSRSELSDEGVRPAGDVHAQARPGAFARPAARARLGLRVREPVERRRRVRPLPAGEGRPAVRARAARDGPWRRLPAAAEDCA